MSKIRAQKGWSLVFGTFPHMDYEDGKVSTIPKGARFEELLVPVTSSHSDGQQLVSSRITGPRDTFRQKEVRDLIGPWSCRSAKVSHPSRMGSVRERSNRADKVGRTFVCEAWYPYAGPFVVMQGNSDRTLLAFHLSPAFADDNRLHDVKARLLPT
ncbi:uncharacterized protein MEPE_06105 [Melanopsichium pennsylvanicum]|uniref:Uncharacterized protein n=1 Tax=Melanopsichium pennsylvanicum TaxID=63383 RepID=A0AAJ4XR97_9BASI|nr:uncharacterized protein MEPE_06105 [Melanopsichium pennsylvanicum]